MDKFITVLVNTCERLMLSALILLIMTFMPVAWSLILYCDGSSYVAVSASFMLFSGSVFFVYCFMRLLWVDVPLTDSSSLVF